MQIRPVVHRVHLVHPNSVEPIGVGLDGVEQRDRLAVGQRHDDVGTGTDVLEHVVGL